MNLIDELTITAQAGRGGNGVVRWLHLKGKEYSGPAGGNGGNGGDVYMQAVRDIGILSRYTGVKHFNAENGVSGENRSRHGKNGKDIVIDIPVGSVVTNKKTGEVYDLDQEGVRFMILKGGRGGLGNAHFKSSTNQSPEKSTEGIEGEEGEFYIELRLVADAGLIGLPNAGKSSLLNALTGTTHVKVGDYAFTTLEPSLGTLYEFVLADIPGLLEGASSGKGLGHKFLRHISRTRILLHCISLEGDEQHHAYTTVREELQRYSEDLARKEEVVILTKSDTRTPEEVASIQKDFEKRTGKKCLLMSVIDDVAVKALRDSIAQRLRQS